MLRGMEELNGHEPVPAPAEQAERAPATDPTTALEEATGTVRDLPLSAYAMLP